VGKKCYPGPACRDAVIGANELSFRSKKKLIIKI
jgi:hypothetical protein